jgi:hypothetical protein
MTDRKSAARRALTAALVTANLFVLVLFVSGWPSGSSEAVSHQSGGKSVIKEHGPRNEPVEVADLKVKGKPVNLGRGFNEETDWLKDVTFSLKNRGGKPITYVRLDIDFPETKETGVMMMHQIYLGRRPDVASLTVNAPLRVEPNGSVEVSLSSEYPEVKKLIELRHPSVEDINRIVIRLGEVMFEDETLYSGGNLFRQHPGPDGRAGWERVTEGQPTSSSI